MGYLFDIDRLGAVVKKSLGVPRSQLAQWVADELAAAYPGHVETRQNWVFNIAAGATGIMNVMHGSLTEYVILFGTPIGTEAYSGRYALEIHDWVLTGEMQTYTEDLPGEAVVSRPGDHAVLGRGKSKGYKLAENSWMLEYGRGLVPSALPTGLSDTLIGALDVRTVLKTFWIYGRLTARELMKLKI
jgi:C-8 sterol isomerase